MKKQKNAFGFKFEIGDWVQSIALGPSKSGKQLSFREQRWHVVERNLQECPGGIQRSYTCRCIFSDGGASENCVRFNEIELVSSQPFLNEPPKTSEPWSTWTASVPFTSGKKLAVKRKATK